MATTKTDMPAERLSAAIESLKPLLPSPAMVRIFLSNQGWTEGEIADHSKAVRKALAAELVKAEG